MKINLVDLHSDLPTSNRLNCEKIEIAKENKAQGVFAINAVYRGNIRLNEALDIANEFYHNGLRVAFEDACYHDFLIQNGAVLGERIKELACKLSSVNPLYVSLGWNYDNLFVGGCAQNGNLTDYGKAFIEELNASCISVDLAHSNKESFYHIIYNARKALCSHAAFEWIYPHRRNLDEEQVKALLNKGGIIGIIAVGHFLSGVKDEKGRELAFYRQLEGYVKKFGVNGLSIGSDFYGSDAPVFLDGDYSFISRLKQFFEKMGVNSTGVEKVLYKNAIDFFANN
jgi:membrane dipeptidase